MTRELEQIVGIARLGGGRAKVLGKIGDREEVLAVAVAADAIGPVEGDVLPEIRGDGGELAFAGQLVLAGRPDDLRDLGVGMFAVELVFAAGEPSKITS